MPTHKILAHSPNSPFTFSIWLWTRDRQFKGILTSPKGSIADMLSLLDVYFMKIIWRRPKLDITFWEILSFIYCAVKGLCYSSLESFGKATTITPTDVGLFVDSERIKTFCSQSLFGQVVKLVGLCRIPRFIGNDFLPNWTKKLFEAKFLKNSSGFEWNMIIPPFSYYQILLLLFGEMK